MSLFLVQGKSIECSPITLGGIISSISASIIELLVCASLTFLFQVQIDHHRAGYGHFLFLDGGVARM